MRIQYVGTISLCGAMLGACAPQQYQLSVDVPAKEVAVPIKTLVVSDFEGGSRSMGAGIAQQIRNKIAADGYIEIVDRSGQMTLTGAVDVGRVRDNTETRTYEVTEKVDGQKRTRTKRVYDLRKRASASARYTLRAGSRTVTGNSFTREYDQVWSADSSGEARMAATADEQIIGDLLTQLAHSIAAAVSPHRETVNVALQGGSHPGLKQGIVYMKAGRLDQAIQLWQQVVDQSLVPKDRAAAFYNIGVIKEAQTRYTDAFAMFRNADMLVPGNKLYIGALSRAEEGQRKQDLLKQQTLGKRSASQR